MNDTLELIAELNEQRYGLDFDKEQAWLKLSEELDEFKEAALKDDEYEMVDALADIIVIAAGEIRKLGYRPRKVLLETLREITSRKQDQEQAKRWALGKKRPGEKWRKMRNQPLITLYKADYLKAKIN